MIVKLHLTDPTTGEPATIPYLESNSVSEVVKTGKAFYADYYVMTLELQDDVVIDETIVIDYPMTIDLNSYTLTSTDGINPAIRIVDGADVTVKNGSIDASGYAFILGASDGSSAGNLTIESGSYKGRITVASVTKGTLTVEGGEFAVTESQYGATYLLNCIDANYKDGSAKIVVKGGTFHNFDPANNAAEGAGTSFVAEGYESTGTDNVWTVEQIKVAEINGVGYPSIQAAVDAAEDGDTVVVLKDLTLDFDDATRTAAGHTALVHVDGKRSITLDLNEKKITVDHQATEEADRLYAVVLVEDNASLVVTGEGKIDVTANETTPRVAYVFWKRGTQGTMTIKNGDFHMNHSEDSMVYTNGSDIVTIEGGTFKLDTIGTDENGSPWIFNAQGQNERNINVVGGTYNADINHQHYCFEVDVPKEFALKNNGDGTWTVVPAVAYVNEQEKSGNWYTHEVGYATLEEAVEAAGEVAKNGVEEVVTLLTNGQSATVSKEVTIMKNGFTATITAGEGFEVEETDEAYVVSVKVEAELFNLYGSNMTLGNDLAMNFFVLKSDLVGTDYYVTITKTYADGRADVVETVQYADLVSQGDLWKVTFNGIAAKEMADDIIVVVYNSDGTPASNEYKTTVRDYAMKVVKSTAVANNVKTVAVDMLNYGAAAQEHFKYNTGDLANNLLSAEDQQKYATKEITCTNNYVKGENYYGTVLSLESNIILNLYFVNITTDMHAVVTYTNYRGVSKTIHVSGDQFTKRGDLVGIVVDDLVVGDGCQVVTCEVYDANDNLVGSVQESMESYVARAMVNAGDGEVEPIYENVMKFVTSAKSYLLSK